MQEENLLGYDEQQAVQYDNVSTYDKGDREKHYSILIDLLKYLQQDRFEFCDLGCGTGFFTRAFFEVSSDSHGIGIDGSTQMLSIARKKLGAYNSKIDFSQELFQNINWESYKNRFDVVFSCLAIHHIDDAQKWLVFKGVFNALRSGGHFIFFDLFRFRNAQDTQLIEYLACRDIQRRLMKKLEIDCELEDLHIDNIILNDRKARTAEGDQEAILDNKIEALKNAGFSSVVTLFQDLRLIGLYCTKK